MKKYCILLLSVLIALTLNSCFEDNPTQPTKTSHWKQTGKVINWQHRDQANGYGNWEQIGSIPVGTWSIDGQWGTMTYGLSGGEHNLTCTYLESWAGGSNITTNFAWDPLPTAMNADVFYNIGAQVTGVNGSIYITNFYNASGTSNDWNIVTDDHTGKTNGKIKVFKPSDETNPDKMAIMVIFTSYYAVIQYIYHYDWVTE